MNWEALAAIGEIVGAVGVIATLGYLAIQIRQNTKSLRASTFQGAVRDVVETLDQVAGDAELTRIWFTGIRGFESLPLEERQRFSVYTTSLFRRLENVVYQTDQGMLDPACWEGLRANLKHTLSQPGGIAWWKRARHLFNQQLREYVEGELLAGRQEPETGEAHGSQVAEPDRP
jgi:hypothetical protein